MAKVITYASSIEAIRAAYELGEDIWDMCVSADIQDRQKEDVMRWNAGDRARLIVKKYGENSLANYAKKVNRKYRTLALYRQVATFWDDEICNRVQILAECKNVTYSHFREAARLHKLKDATYEQALVLATKAIYDWNDNSTTVDAAAVQITGMLGKPAPPVRVFDAVAEVARVPDPRDERHYLLLEIERGADITQLLHCVGLKARIVVYEQEDESKRIAEGELIPREPLAALAS